MNEPMLMLVAIASATGLALLFLRRWMVMNTKTGKPDAIDAPELPKGNGDDAHSAASERLEEKLEYVKAFRKKYLQKGLVATEIPADVFDHNMWLPVFERRRLAAAVGTRHNSLHKFSLGCSEDFTGGTEGGDRLLKWVQGMADTYFNDLGGPLELFTAFAIWYKHDDGLANSGLRLHQDDSDLTVNLALLSEQDGCKVRFEGAQHLTLAGSSLSNRAGVYTPFTEVDVPPGYALLHRGRHPHHVTPIEAGERWSLILWYKARKRAGCDCNSR